MSNNGRDETIKEEQRFSSRIETSHPMRLKTQDSYAAEKEAIVLVGERHEKRDLVRWLILDRAETVRKYMR